MNWHAVKRQLNGWAILSFLAILLIVLPGIVVLVELFAPVNDNWQHIQEYLLPRYVRNTLFIMVATGVLTTVIGTSLAWFVTVYDFPFRRFFKWALILPLAIPPYIGAYTYHGILNYTGVIQTTLRNQFGITVDQSYFNIMSIQGTVFIFTLFLYPYIYTIT
ncbi:MAG: iron ABC transporter permease, partial [Exiguobacterium sp.]|nr:iron ABC transporter permease [Exiguobacterium sp.]